MNTELIIGAFQKVLHKELVNNLQDWIPKQLAAAIPESMQDVEVYQKAVALLMVADGLKNAMQGLPKDSETEFSEFADKLANGLESENVSQELTDELLAMSQAAIKLIEDGLDCVPELDNLVKLAKEFFELD